MHTRRPPTYASRLDYLIICILEIILLLACAPASSAATREAKVLLLYSNLKDKINDAVDESLSARLLSQFHGRLLFFTEELHLLRSSTANDESSLAQALRLKYSNDQPDAIVSENIAAMEFLLKYADKLFPAVPIVFRGIPKEYVADIQHRIQAGPLKGRVAGSVDDTDIAHTIDLALNLQPQTRQVFVIFSALPAESLFLPHLFDIHKRYEPRLRFTYLTDLPTSELFNRISKLPPDGVIVYIHWLRDSTGQTFEPEEVLRQILLKSNVPVYSGIPFLGTGVVGGVPVDTTGIGEVTADLVNRELNGENPERIPLAHVRATPVVDWRALQRWHIDKKRIPPTARVLFRELNIWERYHWYILEALSLCLFEAVLIFALAIQLRKRRRAERAYRLLFEQTLAGVFSCSPAGVVVECNNAFAQMLGKTTEDLSGAELRTQARDPIDFENGWQLLLEEGWLVNREFEMLHKGGRQVTVLANLRLLKENTARPSTVIGTVLDITEVRHLQDQLIQSQKMEAVGRLAGGIAHDFNNLLMVMSGFSELLLKSLTDARQRRHADQVLNACSRAAELTQRLLTFSRKQVVTPRVLNLNSALQDMTRLLQPLVGESIDLRMLLANDLASCKIDPTHLQQIVMNLAVNARDAMPRGGRLVIETANVMLDDSHRNSVNAANVQSGSYVMLSVSDTGVGISPEIQARIFEPFFTTKDIGKGTGLGLSTVYGIVKQNAGYIFLYSEPGRGSSFKIYLPSFTETVPESVIEAPRPTPPQVPATILVVEDEPALRNAGVEFLRSDGYNVLSAANLEEGLRIAREFSGKLDVLLTDIVIPGGSGFDLAQTVNELHPEVRALFMSGYSEELTLGENKDLAGRYLQKPFSFQTLLERIAEVLQSRGVVQ